MKLNLKTFFGSIVVAALGGNPQFFEVSLADDPRFDMIRDSLKGTFGVLTFDDTIKTYALDGQHRLFAIQNLIKDESKAPKGFSDETLSIIFLVQPKDTERALFLKSYRRVFSSLNRHAKPTSQATNIIMDEDDRFAIITRRLISDYEFFQIDVNEIDRINVLADGKAMNQRSTAFANLIVFYEMNVQLLWDTQCTTTYGAPNSANRKKLIQLTPTDEEVENYYEYLERIWDALTLTLPELDNEPMRMRVHRENRQEGEEDNLLFWPIGQEHLFAPLARRLMDENEINYESSAEEIINALKPLKLVPWSLFHNLWKDFLLVRNLNDGNWKMRNEETSQCLSLGRSILYWLTGCENLSEDHLEELQDRWAAILIPPGDNNREDETFENLIQIREEILKL